MNSKQLIKYLETFLGYSLIAILILSALIYAFVFIINWEDWFFGTKLAGLSAGLYLLAKSVTAIVLTVLLVQFPKYKKVITLMAVAYCGFILIDSATTIQKNTGGQQSFSIVLAIFFLIPVLYFMITILASRLNTGKEDGDVETRVSGASAPEYEVKPRTIHIIIGIVGVIALIFIWAILIPIGFSLIAPQVPFEHLNLPEAQDTLLSKVSENGILEWQTILPGYSLDLPRVKTLPECGYIVYGTYWMTGEHWISLRAINVDCRGTVVWDFHQTIERESKNPVTIISIDPAEGKFLVTMSNGKTLLLDAQGKILREGAIAEGNRLPEESTGLPVGFFTSTLPASSVTIRTLSGGELNAFFTVENTVNDKEITSIYAVNPTPDGGYLVSGTVNP
ncbi:MAG: hypothetical protein Q7J03_06755 [Methanoregula sp.]|nr:hypothetical protein [Methanoregula sp.]